MSNLLAMPVVQITVETGNNEDWVDTLVFVVETEGIAIADMPQLELNGIAFEMEVRRTESDAEVIIAASTENGTLMIGDYPNNGYLIWNIPFADMRRVSAGSYVGDVVGVDEWNRRRVIQIGLTVIEGVTK